MIRGFTSTAQPLKITQNCSKTAFGAQNFLRLRRAVRGFAFGTVLDSPKSATLAVTIIPVSLRSEVAVPGPLAAMQLEGADASSEGSASDDVDVDAGDANGVGE